MAGEATREMLDLTRGVASSPLSSEEGREFLQKRLAFFAKLFCLIDASFYVVMNAMASIDHDRPPGDWIRTPHNVVHLVSFALAGWLWWLLVRGNRSYAWLRLIDLAAIEVFAILFSLMGFLVEGIFPDSGPLLAVSNVLMMRAIIVPSAPATTFWLGLGTCVPLTFMSYGLFQRPEASFFTGSPAFNTVLLAVWSLAAVVISTVASRVIYGLQREVKEARRLGQYTLTEKIGSGGMGEVYRATHSMLRRPTAVKLLRPDLAGEGSIARFEREVQLTSRLSHPNTIAIFDYGRTPDGIFYYAMEYLGGFNLDELVRSHGAQPPARVIHILRQVCASLSEAHGLGLIHRDIKPANVLLCERGGVPDVVKVVDFGLVKDTKGMDGLNLSGSGTLTGTPLYFSPETIRAPERTDARSDLYSLGVVGYYLLTGQRLFEGGNLMEICSHHLQSKPVPPSMRLGRPLPEDLERLILKCLEKEPAARPQDAAALRQALGDCQDAGGWTEESACRWWRDSKSRERAPPAREVPTQVLPGHGLKTEVMEGPKPAAR